MGVTRACALFIAVTAANIVPARAENASWPDSLTGVLRAHNHAQALRLILARAGNESLPADFAAVAGRLQSTPAGRNELGWAMRVFDKALRDGFRNANYAAYRARVVDTSVPELARAALLRSMTEAEKKLTSAYRDSLTQLQKGLLAAPTSSADLRAQVLVELGSNPSLTDAKVFLDYARSQDPRLQTAAYKALGQRIRYNRASGNQSGNRGIFDTLKAAAGEAPTLNQVRAMAQISENYARDYLALHCAGQTEKMVAVLRHDADPAYPPLLKATAAFMDSGSQEAALGKVLREEVKDPAQVIQSLLAGTASEAEAGRKLKRAFPELTAIPSTPSNP